MCQTSGTTSMVITLEHKWIFSFYTLNLYFPLLQILHVVSCRFPFLGGCFPQEITLGEEMYERGCLRDPLYLFILSFWLGRVVLRGVQISVAKICVLRSAVLIAYQTPPPPPPPDLLPLTRGRGGGSELVVLQARAPHYVSPSQ
jgi:hypothetical protein